MSLLGAVRVERAYYHCRRCRAGHCPHDALLRLGDGGLTAGAREAACLAGTLGSFAEAAEKVLPKLAGLRLAESTVERAAEAAGADGGAGLEEFLDVYFPRSECILDFYHAAEHLNGLAKALRPGDDEGAKALAGAWCHTLKHRGPAAVLAELRGLDLRGRRGEIREAHRLLVGYIEKNEHRMDYPRYQQEGLLIGSGHVEAACKAVVGQRMKGNGMRWGEGGADALCHLRALFKSEKGQWDAYWAIAA